MPYPFLKSYENMNKIEDDSSDERPLKYERKFQPRARPIPAYALSKRSYSYKRHDDDIDEIGACGAPVKYWEAFWGGVFIFIFLNILSLALYYLFLKSLFTPIIGKIASWLIGVPLSTVFAGFTSFVVNSFLGDNALRTIRTKVMKFFGEQPKIIHHPPYRDYNPYTLARRGAEDVTIDISKPAEFLWQSSNRKSSNSKEKKNSSKRSVRKRFSP